MTRKATPGTAKPGATPPAESRPAAGVEKAGAEAAAAGAAGEGNAERGTRNAEGKGTGDPASRGGKAAAATPGQESAETFAERVEREQLGVAGVSQLGTGKDAGAAAGEGDGADGGAEAGEGDGAGDGDGADAGDETNAGEGADDLAGEITPQVQAKIDRRIGKEVAKTKAAKTEAERLAAENAALKAQLEGKGKAEKPVPSAAVGVHPVMEMTAEELEARESQIFDFEEWAAEHPEGYEAPDGSKSYTAKEIAVSLAKLRRERDWFIPRARKALEAAAAEDATVQTVYPELLKEGSPDRATLEAFAKRVPGIKQFSNWKIMVGDMIHRERERSVQAKKSGSAGGVALPKTPAPKAPAAPGAGGGGGGALPTPQGSKPKVTLDQVISNEPGALETFFQEVGRASK